MSKQLANVLAVILDHGRSLERQTASDHAHILRDAHSPQHLWPEHTTVADLGPLIQIRMETENLHRWLSVPIHNTPNPIPRVKRRLEAHIRNSDLREEVLNHTDQMTQIQIAVGHEQLHLVELRQVRGIHRLISEHAIDRKAPHRLEALRVLRRLVQLLRGHTRRVRAQNVLHRLLAVPVVSVPKAAIPALRVDTSNILQVVLRHGVRRGWIADEESVLRVAGGVALGLEQRVEVPEGGLHELVGGHLTESHFQQDFAELGTDHQQWVQVPAVRLLAQRTEVVATCEGRIEGATASKQSHRDSHPASPS